MKLYLDVGIERRIPDLFPSNRICATSLQPEPRAGDLEHSGVPDIISRLFTLFSV